MKYKLIKSYAKINLSLKILGKNKNKLHKIQSVISFLNFMIYNYKAQQLLR